MQFKSQKEGLRSKEAADLLELPLGWDGMGWECVNCFGPFGWMDRWMDTYEVIENVSGGDLSVHFVADLCNLKC